MTILILRSSSRTCRLLWHRFQVAFHPEGNLQTANLFPAAIFIVGETVDRYVSLAIDGKIYFLKKKIDMGGFRRELLRLPRIMGLGKIWVLCSQARTREISVR